MKKSIYSLSNETSFCPLDERNNVVIQTFFEHYQTSDSSVAVLKRVYRFETLVKVKYILKTNPLFASILFQ